MGVKNCPETPRQRMINMMYIVLTAMLALNVAAEVLEAFRVVDTSLIQTLNAVDQKNKQVYTSFEQAYIENPAKVEEWKKKADEVKVKTDAMIKYIWDLKESIVTTSGSAPVTPENKLIGSSFFFVTQKGDTLKIKKEDDLNVPSEMMITQKKAEALKNEIVNFKEFLAGMVMEEDKDLKDNIMQELDTSDPPAIQGEGGERKTWEIQHFLDKPLVAVLTLLSKLQIDVKNSEANLINYFYSQIDAGSFKFNKLGAQVIANSNIVLQGDEYVAEIFLAAVDTTQDPEITIGNRPVEIVDGKGIYKVKTSETGTFKWGGLIRYKTPQGIFRNYTFEREYQVTPPSVTISPEKMNVFYNGIPNPIDVSSSGMARENLEVEMTNGRVDKTADNKFFVYTSALDEQGKKTTVSVYSNAGGTRRLMGSRPFRVKKVPDPVPQIGGSSGGNIRKEDLMIEDGILATLKDFDFDLKFTITQFDVWITGSGGYTNKWSSTSNRFTADQKNQFRSLTPGSILYIDNIKAKGDDGSARDLGSISFKIR